MNDTQRNKLRMFKTVRDYLTEETAIWNGIPAHVDTHMALTTQITAIDELVADQEAELAGYTVAKQTLRTQLEEKILLVANAAEAYARSVGNEILLAEVDLTPTDLIRTSEQTLDDVAMRVISATSGVMLSLGNYGITPADITELETMILAYEGMKTAPDVKRSQRAGMTAALLPLISAISELLKGQMDTLMAKYKTSSPQFHAGYEAARVIIDLHGPGEEEEPVPQP